MEQGAAVRQSLVVTKQGSCDDRPSRGARVCVSYRCWRSPPNPSELPEAVLLEQLKGQEPLASGEREMYLVGGPVPSRAAVEDDLDSWLQLPPPVTGTGWSAALDSALCATVGGEVSVTWTDCFVVECEVHEVIPRERDIIVEAAGGWARLRVVGASSSAGAKAPRDGNVVRGRVLRIVRGSEIVKKRPGSFGVCEEAAMLFDCRLGDGKLAEGFEAVLYETRVGSRVLVSVAGECLLNDEEEEQEDLEEEDGEVVVVLELEVLSVDDDEREVRSRDAVTMTMDEKEDRSVLLRERGARLYSRGRFRRAEAVWRTGLKFFGMIKSEDTAMDPDDSNMRENDRGRKAAIPLLINEALVLRRRGAFKQAEMDLNEALENDPTCSKAYFHRGQLRVDMEKWDEAKSDLERSRIGVDEAQVLKELRRLAKKERKQDSKDGKIFNHVFADDREALYDDKAAKNIAKARAEMRRQKKGNVVVIDTRIRKPVTKTLESRGDWTASYSEKRRPSVKSNDNDRHKVAISSLGAELEEISDEEEEDRRAAKQAYYNEQLGIGNMRIHLPTPPPPPKH